MSIGSGIYYSPAAIDLATAVRKVPALAQAEAHSSRSERYGYISTEAVLKGLLGEGFEIHGVQGAHVRRADRNGFQKHLIRLRKPGNGNVGEAPEVIIINSHDGSTQYRLLCGMIRFACSNGLIAGDVWSDVRIRHTGDVVSNVIEGSYKVLENFTRLTDTAQEMKSINLSRDERMAFAEAAAPLRFDLEEGEKSPIRPDRFLAARRSADTGTDLWTTFNVVQENMIRGGLQGRIAGANGRMRRTSTREVNGIDQNVKLNQALFTLTERMAELKGMPVTA
jgi:hypothetical protein